MSNGNIPELSKLQVINVGTLLGQNDCLPEVIPHALT